MNHDSIFLYDNCRMEEMEDRFNSRLGLATPTKPPDSRVPVTINKGHSQDHFTVQQQPMEADSDSITSSQHDRWALNEAQIETENYLSDEERKRTEEKIRIANGQRLQLAQDGIRLSTGKKKSTEESSVDSQSGSSSSEEASSSSDEEENSDQDAQDEHEYASDDGNDQDDELAIDQDHPQDTNPFAPLHYSDSQEEESDVADASSYHSETSLA